MTPEAFAAAQAASRERAIAAFPYERIVVPGRDAWLEWQRLRESDRGYPVIVGNEEELGRVAEQYNWDNPEVVATAFVANRSVGQILDAARKLHIPDDINRWYEAEAGGALAPPSGFWPLLGAAPRSGPDLVTDIMTGEFLPEIFILLIPTDKGCEVPAYLKWGGWNYCPPPEYHVALLQSWYERYGAEFVGCSGDLINLRASRPPKTRADALALADEEYRYCPDMIEQGTGSVEMRAAQLMGDPWWDLWWD